MSDPITAVSTAEAAAPLAAYSQAVVANDLVFCSGTTGVDPQTGEVPADITAQAELAFANLAAILRAAGSSIAHVVKTTVFYTDPAEFGAINEVYSRTFTQPYPARSAPGNCAFPRGIRVSVEAIAVLDPSR
jgi:2-iminobutanoate/2-iminopropanoate deaminase